MTTEADIKAEIARIEAMINSSPMRERRSEERALKAYVRPKNAASIILIEGKLGEERIVMGKRNKSLKFMPGAWVFPGGRVDRYDSRISSPAPLHPQIEAKLITHMRGNTGASHAHALGVAAVRELAEETGLLLGHANPKVPQHKDWLPFQQRNIAPAISGLRLIARAITPPGVHRRFDTWFFAARVDDLAHTPEQGFEPSGELEDLQWVRPQDAMRSDTREITRVVLVELMNRLREDPDLSPDFLIPSYGSIRNRMLRKLI